MPLKKKNMSMGILRGNVPLKSVMIGTKCVYGFDFTAFKIKYPSVSEGAGLHIEVNGIRKLIEPANEGNLVVHYDDRISIRTYAEAGYENPVSSVVADGNPVNGTDYSIESNGINIVRSTTYTFTVRGDSTVTISEAVPAPKVTIGVDKDSGIDNVSFYYTKGPYEYSGLANESLETTEDLFTTTFSSIQMNVHNKISTRTPSSVAVEGYKVVSVTKNYAGLLTTDNQCIVTAVSQEGTKVSIVCPPIKDGVTEYALTMVSSEYSRNLNSNSQFYYQDINNPSQTPIQLLKRNNDQYYFYKGDAIKITAKRTEGFKLPSLGKEGEIISHTVTNKQIVLSDENVLVIESGEKGIPVNIVNRPLNTGENVLLSVISEYTDHYGSTTEPQIYVGDRITVPLSPHYRIGTKTHRKPGVGFSADGNILTDISFQADATVVVPNVSVLNVNLRQGSIRSRTQFLNLNPVATFYRRTNISLMRIIYNSISGQTLTPVAGFGSEEYFLDTFDMTYSCKRSKFDTEVSKFIKFTQENVPANFSYGYYPPGRPRETVIVGSYKINSDGKGVTLKISKYDTDWVADYSDQAKLIPHFIII